MSTVRSLGALALFLLLTPTSPAALLGRLPITPGRTDYQAYYDTVLGITWLADADLPVTMSFGVPNIQSNGRMTWSAAQAWIAGINAAIYLGMSEWRLPTIEPVDGSPYLNYSLSFNGYTDYGYNITAPDSIYGVSTASELAHLYYNTQVGNLSYLDVTGAPTACYPGPPTTIDCLIDDGPFANTLPGAYWIGTEYTAGDHLAWLFNFSAGAQYGNNKTDSNLVWPVLDGDIGAAVVPVPTTIWLLGSAIGLLAWMRRQGSVRVGSR